MDIYRDAKRRGIYPPLFTDPEGDSCFSIYQIRWKKYASSISSSETFAKQRAIFLSVRKTVNIQEKFRVTGANQNARKLLSTDLVNTKMILTSYLWFRSRVHLIILTVPQTANSFLDHTVVTCPFWISFPND